MLSSSTNEFTSMKAGVPTSPSQKMSLIPTSNTHTTEDVERDTIPYPTSRNMSLIPTSNTHTTEDVERGTVPKSPPQNMSLIPTSNAHTTEEVERDASLTPTRPYIYHSGHGDFCFLRLVDAYPKPPTGSAESEAGFIRLGSFRLMQLPTEIRLMILKLVVAPLLSQHAFIPKKERAMVLKIQKFSDPYYDNMLRKVQRIQFRRNLSKMENEVVQKEEEEVVALRRRFLPTTRGAYQLTFPRYQIHGKKAHDDNEEGEKNQDNELDDQDNTEIWQFEKIPPTLLATIRNLSNVSCQIRTELGICAWTRSFLRIEDLAFKEALIFLKERPALYQGLKTLSLNISWMPDDRCSHKKCSLPHTSPYCRINRDRSHMCSIALASLIEFIEEHLHLDLIIIHFRMKYRIQNFRMFLDAASSPKTRPPWIDMLQSLTCAKSFSFSGTAWECGKPKEQEDAAETKALLTPSFFKGPEKQGSIIELSRDEKEWWDRGFHYRTQPDGGVMGVASTLKEKKQFSFEKNKDWQSYHLLGSNYKGYEKSI